MLCDGRCFDVTSQETVTDDPNLRWRQPAASSPMLLRSPASTQGEEESADELNVQVAAHQKIYHTLQLWQTRVLCLKPSSFPLAGNPHRTARELHADLLIVNLLQVEGVGIEGSERIIGYTAMSYVWGPPDTSCSLICNGCTLPISRTVAAALTALRRPTEPIYLWIDALCINQADEQEKSGQVAKMLDIYKKANTVVAWLGEPCSNTRLAFASTCITSMLKQKLFAFDRAAHTPSCLVQLGEIHDALIHLFNSPWLRRTWIRQEVYGARHLIMQSGNDRSHWSEFLRAAVLISRLRSRISSEGGQSLRDTEDRVSRLIEEVQLNATTLASGIKPPRNLVEMLITSARYELSDERDTVYAVLGMCNVPTTTRLLRSENPQSGLGAILVDYSKTLIDVYRDASCYLLSRMGQSSDSARLYDFYQPSLLHHQGLASWAVDWRAGVIDEQHWSAIRENLPRYQVSLDNGDDDVDDHPDPHLPSTSAPAFPGESHIDDAAALGWQPPSLLSLGHATSLRVRVRILNYIAYVSDLGCDPADFFQGPYDPRFQIGAAGATIHARTRPRPHTALFSFAPPGSAKYDPDKHRWRIALLGVADDAQLCLVPAGARKGDLVALLAPEGTLPVVLRPIGSGETSTAGGLFNGAEDPYESQVWRRVEGAFFRSQVADYFSETGYFKFVATVPVFTVAALATSGTARDVLLGCFGGLWESYVLYYHFYRSSQLGAWIGTHDDRTARPTLIASKLRLATLLLTAVSTVIISPLLIRLIAGTQPVDEVPIAAVVLSVYCVTLIPIHTYSFLRPVLRQLDDRVVIALRRRKVYEHLDRAKRLIGEDYEFHGPLFVRDEKPRSWLSVTTTPLFQRYLLKFVLMTTNIAMEEPVLNTTAGFNWLLHEVFDKKVKERKLGAAAKFRPIQELTLH